MRTGLLLLLLAGPAAAQPRTFPVAPGAEIFTAKFVAAITPMLQQPFYASHLLRAVEYHVARVAASPDAYKAAEYLRSAILQSEKSVEKLREGLGSKPLPEAQAGAMLVANAMTSPEQFRDILRQLEPKKPGLASHFTRILEDAGKDPKANPGAAAFLKAAGGKVGAIPYATTYDSDGWLATLFDGNR